MSDNEKIENIKALVNSNSKRFYTGSAFSRILKRALLFDEIWKIIIS